MSWFYKTIRKLRVPVPTTFVETGAYMGGGIEYLLHSRRFQQIHSIELSPKWAEHCQKKFEAFPHIHLHEGDSATVLQRMIENNELPNEPVIFYLDAHYSGGETAGEKVDNGCPVLRELEVIAKRNVKGDIIFIDDMRLMGKDSWSGVEGSPIYPLTYFDFRHVTEETIDKAFEGRVIRLKQMCRGFDRMIVIVD
jgi:hypothetical protein